MKTGILFLALCCSIVCSAYAQKTIVKVDLNTSARREAEVNELDYLPWAIKEGTNDQKTFNGVKITFSAHPSLIANYYKTGIQAPNYARLVSDGLSVKGGSTGAQIEMRISGLSTGKHTLLTYHNNIDGKTTDTFSPITIYVDGKLEVSQLKPTFRVHENSEAKTAYLSLNAQSGKDVIIRFEADLSANATNKNIIINAFELNTPNAIDLARLPLPKHGNEHVDADNGKIMLKWTPASTAVSHDVYFGTDSTLIGTATRTHSAFKGTTKRAFFEANSIYSMLTYFWRVDEINSAGKTTKGKIWRFRPRQLAFTGAEGYGRFARGGRGGKVVEVTNLNDDGPGSLREAVTKKIGPRTIVFTVSGIIPLKSRLVISEPYVTIAGQTAPGKGICISRAPLGVVADDAIVRFIRVRLGGGSTYDGMGITGADHSIVDHCSISWTIDEGFSSRGAHNITLQRTLISEALNVAGHANYEKGKSHGFAASIGGEVGSFHHNLLAHNSGRNWSLAGGVNGDGNYLGQMDIRNNVVYNWDNRTTDGGAREVNFVGNYYKPGAATHYKYALNAQHEGYGGGMQRYFFEGNVMPGYFDEKNQQVGRTESGKKVDYQTFVDKPFFNPYVTTQSASDAFKDVLSDVGCNQPIIDDHDIRIINETLNGTYTYSGSKSGKPGLPDSQEDVGGWENYPELNREANFDSDHDGLPDWWEKLHNLNFQSKKGDFSDANADMDKDGFTNLDQYLEWMATPHLNTSLGNTVAIDLKKLAVGYTEKPVFSTSKVRNGTLTFNAEGIVKFASDQVGLGSFEFTVTDASGSKFTRTVNIAILPQ